MERVFYINSNSDRIGYMESGWEVVGDLTAGTAKLAARASDVTPLSPRSSRPT